MDNVGCSDHEPNFAHRPDNGVGVDTYRIKIATAMYISCLVQV